MDGARDLSETRMGNLKLCIKLSRNVCFLVKRLAVRSNPLHVGSVHRTIDTLSEAQFGMLGLRDLPSMHGRRNAVETGRF
jgi:hypothetical protein